MKLLVRKKNVSFGKIVVVHICGYYRTRNFLEKMKPNTVKIIWHIQKEVSSYLDFLKFYSNISEILHFDFAPLKRCLAQWLRFWLRSKAMQAEWFQFPLRLTTFPNWITTSSLHPYIQRIGEIPSSDFCILGWASQFPSFSPPTHYLPIDVPDIINKPCSPCRVARDK